MERAPHRDSYETAGRVEGHVNRHDPNRSGATEPAADERTCSRPQVTQMDTDDSVWNVRHIETVTKRRGALKDTLTVTIQTARAQPSQPQMNAHVLGRR